MKNTLAYYTTATITKVTGPFLKHFLEQELLTYHNKLEYLSLPYTFTLV
jgi:hypothetical protein